MRGCPGRPLPEPAAHRCLRGLPVDRLRPWVAPSRNDVEFSAPQSTLFGTWAPVAYDAPGMARLALVTGATGFMAQHPVPDRIEGGRGVGPGRARARAG